MEYIIEKFYLISKKILETYRNGNYEELKKLIKLENDEYDKTDIQFIINFFDVLILKLNQMDIYKYENYETALYNNDKILITRRLYNKVKQIMNRYYAHEENTTIFEKDLCQIDDNLLIVTQNLDGAFADLEEKIITNIETKYLYFMMACQGIDNNKKQTVFMNTMFVNPYLEEKLLTPHVRIDEFIKKEDELYFNLWKYVRESYESFLNSYCIDTVIDTIETMVCETDLEENTALRFMYLRSLFNSLDYVTLDDIKDEYIKSDLEVENPYGEKLVSIAFDCIYKDNEIIRKIKTR